MTDPEIQEPHIIEHRQEEYRPIVGASQSPDAWQTQRDEHSEKWLGKPSFVWHVDAALLPHVDVYLYEPSEERDRNYYTLLTSGMSDARMFVPSQARGVAPRAEIIQYVAHIDLEAARVDPPWFVEAMFALSRFPFAYRTWLGYSHTVPNGEPPAPFVPDTLLTTALFMEPEFEPEGFRNGLQLGGDQVDLLWLAFITQAELRYKLENGYAAMLERFRIGRFPQLLDLYRTSLV